MKNETRREPEEDIVLCLHWGSYSFTGNPFIAM